MGWCSGTVIFDNVVGFVLKSEAPAEDKKALIKVLIDALEDEDWDCQNDSDYIDDPLVDAVMRRLHPDWEWDE